MTQKTKKLAVNGILFADLRGTEIYYGFLPPELSWYIPDRAVRIDENFSVEMTVPVLSDLELRMKMIQTLEKQKVKIYADAEISARAIQDKIDQLLLLTDQSTDSSAIEGEVL